MAYFVSVCRMMELTAMHPVVLATGNWLTCLASHINHGSLGMCIQKYPVQMHIPVFSRCIQISVWYLGFSGMPESRSAKNLRNIQD